MLDVAPEARRRWFSPGWGGNALEAGRPVRAVPSLTWARVAEFGRQGMAGAKAFL